MIRICLASPTGKMGEAIISEISHFPKILIKNGLIGNTSQASFDFPVFNGVKSIKKICENIDIWMDFTTPAAFLSNLNYILENKIAIVVGTTGWYDQYKTVEKQIKKARVPVLISPNFSYLVNLQFYLTRISSKTLYKFGYSFGIVEEHHENKIDIPSGTAEKIADIILKETEYKQKKIRVRGKEKKIPSELDMAALRLKGTVGDHELRIRGENGRMDISTSIYNRKELAQGALYATEWLYTNGEKGKIYSFDHDVLGLKKSY